MNAMSQILKKAREKVGDKRYFGEGGVLEAFRQSAILSEARVYKVINEQEPENEVAYLTAIELSFPDVDFTEWNALFSRKFVENRDKGHFGDDGGKRYLETCLATFGARL